MPAVAATMQQHAFYNGIGAFTVMVRFFARFPITSFAIDLASSRFPLSASSFSSASNSLFTSEKLFTKLSGFCISWAMPAVSWPRLAIFSEWMSWDWVDLRFSWATSSLWYAVSISRACSISRLRFLSFSFCNNIAFENGTFHIKPQRIIRYKQHKRTRFDTRVD
jgi:hypothetical protein